MVFSIETDVPAPRGETRRLSGRHRVYPFAEMKDGESFLVSAAAAKRARQAALAWKRRHPGWDYRTGTVANGDCRIWCCMDGGRRLGELRGADKPATARPPIEPPVLTEEMRAVCRDAAALGNAEASRHMNEWLRANGEHARAMPRAMWLEMKQHRREARAAGVCMPRRRPRAAAPPLSAAAVELMLGKFGK